jgi:hypothetical protein
LLHAPSASDGLPSPGIPLHCHCCLHQLGPAAHGLVVYEVTGRHAAVCFNGNTQSATLSIHPLASVASDHSTTANGTQGTRYKAVSLPFCARFPHVLQRLVHVNTLDLLQRQSSRFRFLNLSKGTHLLPKTRNPFLTQGCQLAYLLNHTFCCCHFATFSHACSTCDSSHLCCCPLNLITFFAVSTT